MQANKKPLVGGSKKTSAIKRLEQCNAILDVFLIFIVCALIPVAIEAMLGGVYWSNRNGHFNKTQ